MIHIHAQLSLIHNNYIKFTTQNLNFQFNAKFIIVQIHEHVMSAYATLKLLH
jgi:hypothetical protein